MATIGTSVDQSSTPDPASRAPRPVGLRPRRLPARTVTWGLIGVYVLAHAAWTTAANLGFRARLPGLDTLSANVLGLALLVMGLLFLVGRLRPADVGLRARDIGAGLIFTALYFGLLQLLLLSYASLSGAQVVNLWARAGAVTAAYLLLAQLLGNALYEEVAFRGFLLPQLFLKLRRLGVATAMVLAVVASQTLFSVAHVPNILWVRGAAPAELPGSLLPLFLMGLYFALLYLLTDNLFAVVGVHALNNEPLLALVGEGSQSLDMPHFLIAAALSLTLAVIWRYWLHVRGRR